MVHCAVAHSISNTAKSNSQQEITYTIGETIYTENRRTKLSVGAKLFDCQLFTMLYHTRKSAAKRSPRFTALALCELCIKHFRKSISTNVLERSVAPTASEHWGDELFLPFPSPSRPLRPLPSPPFPSLPP